jgi:hypothetical protein
LRERFREHDLPKEIDFPPPEEYESFELTRFADITLKHGYHLEVVWLPEERIWALRLTEPDLGPSPGAKKQIRQPVPGRIFETNISYKATDKGVFCGFLTMVSEPVGTTETCEVFRLGFIKHLKRNPRVGLEHVWELKEEPHLIKTSGDIKNFKKKLSTDGRTLPVVVVSEYVAPSIDANPTDEIPDLDKLIKSNLKSSFQSPGLNLPMQKESLILQASPILPSWLDNMSNYRMGYAHFFVVADTIREELCHAINKDLPNGGILFVPSPQTEEKETHYTYNNTCSKGFDIKLGNLVQNYSKDKRFDFSFCTFVPQAQELQDEKMLKSIHSETELRKIYADKLAHLEDRDSKRIAEIEGDHQRQYRKLEQELDKALKKAKTSEEKYKRQQSRLVELNSEIADFAKRLEISKTRPSKPASICEWVTQHFDSRIIIHDRAQRLMKDIQNEEVDVNLLCDALEYLANEHWDLINGNIDAKECQRLCSLYYNRPFEYGECGDRNIKDYASDYTIKHKKENALLTHHLKVGKDPMRLVRIYYFYDKTDQKIVVGSMPKHLRITSY